MCDSSPTRGLDKISFIKNKGGLRLYLSLLPVISTPLNDREFPIERNLVEGFDSAQLSRFRSWGETF
jgi:hypothetical protein